MPDKEVQQVLLFLLRSGLWAELTAEQLAPLSAQQWASLYHYAQQHTIEGIVFDGLQLLPAGLMPPRALVLKWTVRVDQIERHNKQMAACMKSQLDCFQAEVNGQVLKHIYQRLGILKWIHLLHAVLVKYIGLPAASLPFPIPEGVNADWMMEEICRAGNFGFSDTNRDAVSQKISSNVRKYFKYAPMEALSFPVLQFISKFAGK